MSSKRHREPLILEEGLMVRLDNRPGRITRIRLNGLVDVQTDYGLRTVHGWQLAPAKPGDTLMPTPAEWRTRRQAGTR